MCKKCVCLIMFVLVWSLVANVQAANVTWVGEGPEQMWSTPGNWDTGAVPTAADTVNINNGSPGPIVVNEGLIAKNFRVGNAGSDGTLTIDGGTLEFTHWSAIGAFNTASNGTVIIKNGTLSVGNSMVVGNEGTGTLNMIGGNLALTFHLEIGRESTGIGHVNLDGGVIQANDLKMGDSVGAVGTMDVGGGTLLLRHGNDLATVQGYIDNGWITAYGGNGTLYLDYDETNAGLTTLKAIHNLNPNPTDDGLASPGNVELSWTLPDPCVPGQPVLVDVYVTDDYDALWNFLDPQSIRVVSQSNVTSTTVHTNVKTRYYWAVDTYIGDPNDPILGPIFSFYADNVGPEVEAGANVVTWLVDGVRTRNLVSTITDDGFIEPYTAAWTVISEPDDPNSPDAVIADPSAQTTSVSMSAAGEYVLQVEAFDGEYTGSDTLTINVYADSCEAAKALPDYEPLVGDLNGDCKVDDLDQALLLENWLKDISLTEEVELD